MYWAFLVLFLVLNNTSSKRVQVYKNSCDRLTIFLFQTSYRQYQRYLQLERPTELADIVSKADFTKAQAYNLDKSRFGFIESFYKQFETVLLLHYDALPYIWDLSGDLLFNTTGYGSDHEVFGVMKKCMSKCKLTLYF